MAQYEPIRYKIPMGGGEFIDAEWCDITAVGDDKTTWRIRCSGGTLSFRAVITGRTARTAEHPIPATETLKVAMLLAVRDEMARLNSAGGRPGEDHPVAVSEQNVSDAVRLTSPTR